MIKFIRHLKIALSSDLVQSDLATLLSELNPTLPFSDRMNSLGKIMNWVRLPVKSTAPNNIAPYLHSRDIRIKFLFQFLERNQKEAEYFATTLKELIVPGGAVGLYCLTGMSENHGFFTELSNRLIQHLLPESFAEKDLSQIFKAIFTEEEDAIWLESSLGNVFSLFQDFFSRYQISFENLRLDGMESMVILGAQVASLGTSRDIRRRLNEQRLIDSSFLRLNAVINAGAPEEEVLQEVSASRVSLQTVRESLEASGVSVNLIFKLEKISFILDRIEMIIYLNRQYGKEASPLITGQFMGRLVRAELHSLSVRDYLYENLHLLTRKIVERAGDRGTDYIANTPSEKKALFVAAAWAGILTAFTAVVKFVVLDRHFPLFYEGFFFFLNYAFAFLMMQKFHLALSSKQPAYTASALSKKFETFKQKKELEDVTSEIRKIINSQFITFLGNLIWVIPFSIAFDWGWVWVSGHHLMSTNDALAVIHKHNLIESLTIPYAVFTGVILWFSSVIAGWVENWIVYQDLPLVLRSSPLLKKVFSGPKLKYISDHLAHTVGGIAGNVSIAFMMAVPIIIGKFMALPFDIRHVTLSSGSMTLALNSLGWGFNYWPLILSVASSILVIGLINFSVSFYCALRMAALAREVDSKYLRIIFKYALTKRRQK